jgi:hypothetical protein
MATSNSNLKPATVPRSVGRRYCGVVVGLNDFDEIAALVRIELASPKSSSNRSAIIT